MSGVADRSVTEKHVPDRSGIDSLSANTSGTLEDRIEMALVVNLTSDRIELRHPSRDILDMKPRFFAQKFFPIISNVRVFLEAESESRWYSREYGVNVL